MRRNVHRDEIRYRISEKFPHNEGIRKWHRIFVVTGNMLRKKEHDIPRKSNFTVQR
jgi:hypothetical protein